jgi:CheY-like chemotaxis protein
MHKEKGTRILVVDDERAITLTLTAILEREGYETATANGGEEAVDIACSFQPDFLLSDIDMGAMNGVEAAIEVLRFLPNCKVLFITGHLAYEEMLGGAKAQGFDFEVLRKPIPPAELLAKISQVLSGQPTAPNADATRKPPAKVTMNTQKQSA